MYFSRIKIFFQKQTKQHFGRFVQLKIDFSKFSEIHFKVHLLIEENRFEAVPERFRQYKTSNSRH